ncbi:YesL family protein [Neobacillus cucumis]|uniref:YesL family protein n=1 Tax=Neobacillus cucumis TaxID=1740721 RepID=UPI001FDC1E22|nr:putative membrane protein YesL [Neobacillus cucumis]
MLSTEGFLYRICIWIYHVTLLNFLFLITCIPIITIFPSLAAAFGVSRQWIKKNDPPIITTYFKLFKENFRQSMIVGIFIMIVGLLLYADFHIIVQIHTNIKIALYLFFCFMIVFYIAVILHIFPLMVNGFYSSKQLLVNALKFSLYKFHLTLLNMVCIYMIFFIAYKFPVIFVFFFSSICIFLTYWHINRKFVILEALQKN